ncbi:hypothetical protein LCGC14_2083760 [marine sediment metagenome]|uniref:Uncharacterized protein n=1 Tax=marine sediment metagenome TaxID=412755 RepID=A0A0F9EEN7_9ZZZZ
MSSPILLSLKSDSLNQKSGLVGSHMVEPPFSLISHKRIILTCKGKSIKRGKKGKGGGKQMKYIVKLAKYKNKLRVHIPIKLVREQDFKKYKYVVMEKFGPDNIVMRGYKDGEKFE